MTDTIRAAVYGHLVGDAIGVPYEFGHHIETVELRGHGTHNQPPARGATTARSCSPCSTRSSASASTPRTRAAARSPGPMTRAYTPDGDGAFDIGGATAASLARLRGGTPAIDAGGTGERDQGNGSLMRILPIALVDPPDDDAELVERAHLASRVTHGHPNCQVACALYVLVARTLIEHPGGDPEAALALATDRLLAVYAREPEFASVLRELLAHRSSVKKPGGGWVLDSFWSAWEAFASSGSYRETIERAVRLRQRHRYDRRHRRRPRRHPLGPR